MRFLARSALGAAKQRAIQIAQSGVVNGYNERCYRALPGRAIPPGEWTIV